MNIKKNIRKYLPVGAIAISTLGVLFYSNKLSDNKYDPLLNSPEPVIEHPFPSQVEQSQEGIGPIYFGGMPSGAENIIRSQEQYMSLRLTELLVRARARIENETN